MANPTPSVAASRLPVDVRVLPWIRRLTADYTHEFAPLAEFFAGDPRDPAAWAAAIERARATDRPRAAIADAIVAQQRRFLAPPAAIAAAEQLRDRATVAVLTGQQAGLFGGPLYTLLKALTAITLAADIRARHHVPVVPVFWIDSEDHDWDEVATCWVLDRELERRPVALPRLPGAGMSPIAAIRLDQTARPAIDALRDALPATEFTASLLDRVREAYGGNDSVSGAFARWLLSVLGLHGLVVYDASDSATKPFVRSVFERELREVGRTSALAAAAGRELVARGYHAQVTPADDAVALFHLDGGRQAIHRAGNDFVVGAARRTAGDLLNEVERRPDAFSPNVLLRPIVQDSLFPSIAYVAGPNELAYLAQLRGVYARFGVPMPLMFPRDSATLVDSAAMRFLQKSGVNLPALAREDEAELNRLLEQQLPPEVEHAWQDTDASVRARMETLAAAVRAVDPTLEGAVRSALGRMTHDLGVVHDKIVHAAKRRDQTLRRQFGHARSLAFPGGEPQERAVGFVYFLNQYGPVLVDRLLAELPLDGAQHWVITI